MKRALAAGSLYFLLIFLAGMVFGTVRVLVVEPRLGAVGSVLLELPVMLTVSWLVCGWLIRYLAVPAAVASRLLMGATAFLLLMASELGLDLLAMGGTVTDHFASYRGGAPLIGPLGQIAFAAFPILGADVQNKPGRRRLGGRFPRVISS